MTAAASPDILLGTVLEGRYQLLSVLGRGGMGSVYIAEDIHLHRRCAVKVLHPQFAEDRTNVERFLREAQMIARLQHPNIVDIYAYGEDPSGLVFFAMELLEGEDLYRRLKARDARPYSVHEACLWALQVTRAVGCVHEAGLIHRDLKTPNIFLARKRDGEEVVKLLDFGIARPEEGSELTQTGMLLGTPSSFSSPSLAAVSPRSARTTKNWTFRRRGRPTMLRRSTPRRRTSSVLVRPAVVRRSVSPTEDRRRPSGEVRLRLSAPSRVRSLRLSESAHVTGARSNVQRRER